MSLWFGRRRKGHLHGIVPLVHGVVLLNILWCHNILYFAKYFESWVLLHLSSQIMFRWIRLLFQGILVHYYHALGRHIWVLIHSSLLRADLRISTLVRRILPRFCLIDHSGRARWLVTSLLLVVTDLAIGHLLYRGGLHVLVVWHNGLEVHHIMFHVGLRLRLRDNTGVQIRLLGHVGVADTNIPHIFGWTRLESLNCALQRFASLLNSWFTIGFHQGR